MRKIFTILLAIILCISVLGVFGCGNSSTDNGASESNSTNQTKQIETSIVKYEITESTAQCFVDSIGTKHLFGLVEITNTGNVDLYLSSGQFDYEDESGKLLQSSKYISVYPTVIKPNEKAYYQDESLAENIDVNQKIVIVPTIKAKKSTIDYVRFETSDIAISTDMFNEIEITGRVKNTSVKNESYIYVVALLRNSSGKVIAVLMDIVTSEIEPNQKIGFSASTIGLPNTITQKEVENFIVIAYPNQFQL